MRTVFFSSLFLALLLTAQTGYAQKETALDKYAGCWQTVAKDDSGREVITAYHLDMRAHTYAASVPEEKKYTGYFNFQKNLTTPGKNAEKLVIGYGGNATQAFTRNGKGAFTIEGPSFTGDWATFEANECSPANSAAQDEFSRSVPKIWGTWRGKVDGEEMLIELDPQNKTVRFPKVYSVPQDTFLIRTITETDSARPKDKGKYRLVIVGAMPKAESRQPGRMLRLPPLCLYIPLSSADPVLWEPSFSGDKESPRVELTKSR